MSKFVDNLDSYAALGEEACNLFGATADLLRALRSADDPETPMECLTGDHIADAAFLRSLGVEHAIKAKWNVDLEQVLKFLGFLVDAFSTITAIYKDSR